MKPEHLKMIHRVALEHKRYKNKKGKQIDGPYWFGYLRTGGKQLRIYIGKELPQELEILLKTRTKPPGAKNYVWPGRPQEPEAQEAKS